MQTTGGASLSRDDTPEVATRGRRVVGVLVVVAAVVVVLDQLSKAIALDKLADGRAVHVIDGWLQLRLVYNPGAAFGFATGYTIVLTLVATGVVVVILRISRRLANVAWAVALGGMLGGAMGNLTDRIFRPPGPLRGHVIDWIELPHWPLFNLADSAIVGAAVLMVLLSMRGVDYDRVRPR